MITIVMAGDQELVLGTIGSLLNLEDDMEVVGEARNGEEVLALVAELRPDICIMDIEMLENNGLAQALNSFESKVIFLTTFGRKGNFRRVVNADVRGYLLKDTPSEELTDSIRSIMDGMRIYSPTLMEDDTKDESVEPLSRNQVTTDTSNQQNNTQGTVRSYFSTFKDKMKLPAG